MTDNPSGWAGRTPGGLAEGALVAGYRIEERIGTGGMAVVYRAYDTRLRRQVALKVMSEAAAADEAFRQRFVLESRAAAAVDDPHIIPVYEAGESHGTLFIAMRYVAGGDVHSLVRRAGPLPAARAMAIISPVALALDAAHAAGLVHRDVKPANMLLDARPGRPDHVYLSDFGLSKGSLASRGLTGAGQFLGTPDYTAPEQMQARPTDGRADQYALACSAFELLTGAPPFDRDQVTAVIWAHMSESPPPLASRRPDLPEAADGVLRRALAKQCEDRYATCREFTEALRRALGEPPNHSGSRLGEHARHEVTPAGRHSAPRHAGADDRRSPAASGRSRRAVLLGCAAAAVTAAGGGAWMLAGRPAGQRTRAGSGSSPIAAPASRGGGSLVWQTTVSAPSQPWLRVAAGGEIVYLQGVNEIVALRASDGTRLWTFTVHGDNRVISGLAATPAAVYVAHITTAAQSALSALGPGGSALWTVPMVAQGVAVAGERVFTCAEQSGQPGVYALAAASGRRLWRIPATAIGTPAVAGGVVYALAQGSPSYRMQAVSAASGRPLWSEPADWSDQPVLADSDTVCLVSQASDTIWVWAATGGHRWTSDAGGGIVSAAVAASAVYAITRNGSLLALEAISGRLRWQQPASAVIKPVVYGGMVYAGSADGGIVARRTGDGSQLWKSSVRILTAGPAVADGLLYAAGAGSAVALRA